MGKTKAYPAIKGRAVAISDALMNIPCSPVWIHEKSLCKMLKMPRGVTFGQRDSLTCILVGIKKGYCGNLRGDHIKMNYTYPDFLREKSGHDISFQKYGAPEPFVGSQLTLARLNKPRWFRSRNEPVGDVKTQLEIVDKLVGETRGLSEEVEERRQNSYKQFLDGGATVGLISPSLHTSI